MNYWGINALNHGCSLAVVKNGDLKFWQFNNSTDRLPSEFIKMALNWDAPDEICWYERPWIKKARQLKAGQYHEVFDMEALPKKYLRQAGLSYPRVTYTPHHASHAAAGYYTSPFNHCAIVVLDAIGEFECASIWEGKHGELTKVWSANYPNSLGLFYSAFTKLLGLTPIKDEYLLQEMSTKGDPRKYRSSIGDYFNIGPIGLNYNFHRGVINWPTNVELEQEKYDIAAAVQERFEIEVAKVMHKAKTLTGADCLVYMGGCAMNSQANTNEVERMFKYRWSLPQPGDPSSAIGAVLYHTKDRIQWVGPLAKHLAINV